MVTLFLRFIDVIIQLISVIVNNDITLMRCKTLKTIKYQNHKNIIFKRLAEARMRLNLSQQDLAIKMQVLGVSIDQQAISKIELDKRIVTDYELMCFCKVLNVSEKWLFGEFDEYDF